MRTVAISEFKATCLALLEEVRVTGEPLVITKRGVPIAQVGPPSLQDAPRRRLGGLAGRIRIIGDIVEPASDPSDWEVLR
ncbi:MAG: hypothetical protein JWM25_489 [Thermoleophilia bacterium]|nr:hypothetical protein [Thermoleophilia bacterium]